MPRGVPDMVLVDGSGERWRPVGMRVWMTLQSERTGSVVTVEQRDTEQLAVEIDGRVVKPLGRPARAGST